MSFSELMAPAHQFSIDEMLQGDLTQKDRKRLTGGYLRVFNVMKDGVYRSPEQISEESGVRLDSALRMCRLMKQRGHGYGKMPCGNGFFMYQIIPSFDEM